MHETDRRFPTPPSACGRPGSDAGEVRCTNRISCLIIHSNRGDTATQETSTHRGSTITAGGKIDVNAAAKGANTIGNLTGDDKLLNSFTNKVAHAIAGCAAGAAKADNSGGCGAGALGAAIGELAASQYDPMALNANGNTVQFAGLMSSLAVAVAGGSAEDIAIANAAGQNAAANNWLHPKEQEARKARKRAESICNSNPAAAECGVLNALNNLDKAREAENSGTLYKGITDGLISLLMSPVTAPVELLHSVGTIGAGETALSILKGVALLPTNIAIGLQSSDPEVQGRALVDALATSVGVAALARSGFIAWKGAATNNWALEAAITPYSDTSLSQAARAWDKHDTSRQGGTYEPLTGNAAAKNETAAKFVISVINDPQVIVSNLSRGAVEYSAFKWNGVPC